MTVSDSDGNIYGSIWELMDSLEDNHKHPDLYRKIQRLRGMAERFPRLAKNTVKFAYQRVVRGWDDSAIWDIYGHLASSLGAQLIQFSKIAHGMPNGYGVDTTSNPSFGLIHSVYDKKNDDASFSAWTSDLLRYGKMLSRLSTVGDELPYPEKGTVAERQAWGAASIKLEDEAMADAKKAMHWVADNFDSLWD